MDDSDSHAVHLEEHIVAVLTLGKSTKRLARQDVPRAGRHEARQRIGLRRANVREGAVAGVSAAATRLPLLPAPSNR